MEHLDLPIQILSGRQSACLQHNCAGKQSEIESQTSSGWKGHCLSEGGRQAVNKTVS